MKPDDFIVVAKDLAAGSSKLEVNRFSDAQPFVAVRKSIRSYARSILGLVVEGND
jgi:hypothetical protein